MAAFDPFANLSPIGGRKQQQQAPAAGQGGYGQSQPVSSNPFDTFGPTSGAATNTNGQRGGGVAARPGGGFIRPTPAVAAEAWVAGVPEADLAVFDRALAADVDFTGATLVKTEFYEADLRRCSFRDANLVRAEFDGCDLRGADFTGADLTATDISDCDLRGAVLPEAQRAAADLSGNREE